MTTREQEGLRRVKLVIVLDIIFSYALVGYNVGKVLWHVDTSELTRAVRKYLPKLAIVLGDRIVA